ncbi:hypothetical protein D0863_10438 [Hortaea werneckii]|uniref:Uncharacterized protein n=1 Tax=Hortaea werneckii TaxID=91943 RepID=A0A3M7DHB1_HORWE|nr:hypothetical protein D0863_10438 [Hortaea werneckii]
MRWLCSRPRCRTLVGSGSALPKNDNCRLITAVRISSFVIAHSSFDDDYPKSFKIRWPISAPLSSSSGNVITEPPRYTGTTRASSARSRL